MSAPPRLRAIRPWWVWRARSIRRAAPALALLIATAALLQACGGGDSPSLDVSAAASLRKAFTVYAKGFPSASVRFSFAGSDALAAQIEHGIRPDVFASANTELPQKLYGEGLVERPVVFAANRLVLAVPAGSRISSLGDVERPGVSLAVGTSGVPVGAYAQKVIGRLAPAARRELLANIRDREPDVTGIVGKLTQGAVDVGLVYATDVRAAGGRLRQIELAAALQPQVAYGAAVVKGSSHLAQARAFVSGLLGAKGRSAMLESGFLPPP